MKKILFIIIILLCISGCDDKKTLLGRWISTDNNCKIMCSFNVIERENIYSSMEVRFDTGSYHNLASGPLIKLDMNRYIIKSKRGDFLLVIKNDKIYTLSGSIYEKKH